MSHRSDSDVPAGGPVVTMGIFADPHYSECEPWNNRCFADSSAKLAGFVVAMNEANPAFLISLGDMIDKGESVEDERRYLRHISKVFDGFKGPRHYVLGNHDLATFTKDEFMSMTGMQAAHYAFDCGAVHCIVLDANYRRDFSPYEAGNFDWRETYIPPDQQEWLRADLANAKKKTIVFVHQPLDDENSDWGVKNAPEVRRWLEHSGNVVAVFQGHTHPGSFRRIRGIPYFTMRGMVEGPSPANNAAALVRVTADAVEVHGFGTQPDYFVESLSE